MDRFSTHLNILKAVFQYKKINTSLEFGMGNFSTNFLLENTKDVVTSIEMQDQNWYYNLVNSIKNERWNPILCLGPNSYLDLSYDKYDFILVDGHGATRPEVVNFCADKTDIIVAHDTEAEHVYGWSRVKLDDEWLSYEDKKVEPWTKIWTKDQELIKIFKNK